jgi:GTP cyclohydrolase III
MLFCSFTSPSFVAMNYINWLRSCGVCAKKPLEMQSTGEGAIRKITTSAEEEEELLLKVNREAPPKEYLNVCRGDVSDARKAYLRTLVRRLASYTYIFTSYPHIK